VDGFLNIDKPAGITSHDVVARIRRLARQKRVGHAGTLDPAATGVLVVGLGSATRLIEYVQEQTRKRYLAEIRLGVTTSTDDAEGEVVTQHVVPTLDDATIGAALQAFHGTILQVPPAYSALHHNGQRLYDLARAGVQIDIPARPVTVDAIRLLAWASPSITLEITCGKGTYIRSIARDLGAALGCGGHLASLRRTMVGTFLIEHAVTLAGLEQASAQTSEPEDQAATELQHHTLAHYLLPPETAVADWPRVDLTPTQITDVRNGRQLSLAAVSGDHVRAHGTDGALLALLRRSEAYWQPEKVFHPA
jgi:tRNA pseudouridine55 synthase